MFKRIWALMKHWRDVKRTLSALSYFCMKDNHALDELGSLTDEELNAVKAWASEKEGAVVVEVGTLFGLTAREMARSNAGGRVVAVDNFSWNPFGLPSKVHESFTRQILRGSGVEIVNCDSEDWREKFKGKIDMVFFDASHRYEDVKAECEWAKAAGIKMICGHDYGNPNPLFGVTRAVDEVFGKENVEVVGMCWRVKN
jgi:precorrin-6B methylase 2